jgi:SulP family sulfate permease
VSSSPSARRISVGTFERHDRQRHPVEDRRQRVGRSQVAAVGLVVAALTIVTLLFLTGLFEELPEATLGAVVIAALVELVDIDSLIRFYRVHTGSRKRLPHRRPADFTAALAALVGVLAFDTLPGLFIGISVSLLLLLYRASRPHIAVLGRVPGNAEAFGDVERRPEKELIPGIVVLRVEGGLFFANADTVRERVVRAASEGTRAIVLDAETVPYIDLTAAEMLTELTGTLAEKGVRLVVARELGQVRDVARHLDGSDALAPVYPSVPAAIEALQADSFRRDDDSSLSGGRA